MSEIEYWKRRFEERDLTVNELAHRIEELEWALQRIAIDRITAEEDFSAETYQGLYLACQSLARAVLGEKA